jgi:hypothetical protein
MEDKARVARLIAVFSDLPNRDKDLVLKISEAIKQGVHPVEPEGGGVVNRGRSGGGIHERGVQDGPGQPVFSGMVTVSSRLGDTPSGV